MHTLRTSPLALMLSITASLAFTAAAHAVPFAFNASGQNAAFGWNSNYVNGGHFNAGGAAMGSPTVTTDGMFFQNQFGNMNFLVAPGETINSENRWLISINNSANPPVQGSNPAGAAPFQFIKVREEGTYNSADPLNDFSITQTFSVFRYQPLPPGTTGNIQLPNVTFHPNGTWDVEYTLNVGDPIPNANLPFQTLQLTLTNIIGVDGAAPAGTFMRKTYAAVIFPEPGTLALLAFAAPLVLRRRRK
jgi:hypothetical protein